VKDVIFNFVSVYLASLDATEASARIHHPTFV